MPSKLTDEERLERIREVGDYYCNNDVSVRSTVEYFKSKGYDISTATVSTYLKAYKRLFSVDEENVQKVIDSRKPVTYKDPFVKKRILEEVKLLRNGYTVQGIADFTGVDYWTVSRDLTTRLKKLDKELYEDVSIILNNNSLSNLRRK